MECEHKRLEIKDSLSNLISQKGRRWQYAICLDCKARTIDSSIQYAKINNLTSFIDFALHIENKIVGTVKKQPKTNGKLVSIGHLPYGYLTIEFFQCQDCGNEYPVINKRIMCNGREIILCPYCRKNHKPEKYGA